MPRLPGEVRPYLPPDAPLELRLPAEVYALDGDGDEAYVMPYPGGHLEVGPDGHLFETLGATDPEQVYKKLAEAPGFAQEFAQRCASYGITKAKYGTSWDDRCMEHEYGKNLGPFAPAGPPAKTVFQKYWWAFAISAGALIWVLKK